jgi:23S rRNA (pseudouridine1915-N3)-methyltransferase
MQIVLLSIGKTSENYLVSGQSEYLKRLKKYCKFSVEELPGIKGKKLSKQELMKKEDELFLRFIKSEDTVILLDDKGKNYTSIEFSKYIESLMVHARGRLLFVIGGAYGFSDTMRSRYKTKLSLSTMTFSHQIIRLIFLEQIYRAFTILNNDPYHNE